MEQQGEIILYQPDESVRMEVRIEDETVWLTQAQIAELFETKRQAITKHLKNIFQSGELNENSVCSILELTASDGKSYKTKTYNLDAIISVAIVSTAKMPTLFRRWASQVLKDYLLKGHVINQRISNLEQRVDAKFLSYDMQLTRLNEKVDFFVRTSLPPVEGIFFDGQIFDAYAFATNLIKSAKNSLILIDNYIDESTLLMLSKLTTGVDATIYTQRITPQLQLDLTRHNNQYPPINIRTYRQAHDRFLIIDQSDVYHIGASLKDLGKKLFAFSRMDIPASILTKLL